MRPVSGKRLTVSGNIEPCALSFPAHRSLFTAYQ